MFHFARTIAATAGLAVAVFIAPFLSSQPALAQFKQQGNKLVGTGATGTANQAGSVALSADGSTAIIGGPEDNTAAGAAWVFTRTKTIWKQQGQKLVGSNAVGAAQQGTSVAVSSDGNTAITGGWLDDSAAGAVWVFTRSNGAWTQQGNKLVGTGATGAATQGFTVALSADGNTAIVGGISDNTNAGAVWVFARSNGVWSQQGNKLVGTGAVGAAQQGWSVGLSADGNTAIVGGYSDNTNVGAAWVFTRSNGVWTQQGNKLVGTGATGAAQQGWSVALSADGNTAIIGGNSDNTNTGASWVFVRKNGVWSQQGHKLVGTGATGAAQQGFAASLSSDGNIAVISGDKDNAGVGATWVFTRVGTVWRQQGSKLVGTGATGAVTANQGVAIALSSDGNTALVGGDRDNSNAGAAWVFVTAPAVTAIGPSGGPQAGGTTVTIKGKNFTGATAVKFGVTAATSFTVRSANTIVAHTPRHRPGAVAISVTTPAGTGTKASAFTFAAPPAIATVSPESGTATGGTTVTIRGRSLAGAMQVKFGVTPAASFKVTNSTTIVAHTPKHPAGKVTVMVRTAGGVARKANAFMYE